MLGACMKITLAKHGGLAAGIRLPPHTVDSATLPGGAADELKRLVSAAKSVPRPAGNALERARDAMSYTLTLQDDDGKEVVLRQSDVDMTAPFANLLDWINRHTSK